jgi:hypothetical protein
VKKQSMVWKGAKCESLSLATSWLLDLRPVAFPSVFRISHQLCWVFK